MNIKNHKEFREKINLNTDGQSVIVQNGLRVRGYPYKLTDGGVNSVDTEYIGFQNFYEKHGFLEECPNKYNIYLVRGAAGVDKKIYAQEDEMQNPLIIPKELIKKLEGII